MVRALLVGSGMVGALLWVAPALAGPAATAYNGEGNVANQVGSGGVAAASGVLPFTGLSLALIVGAAVLLLAAGLLMRRASRAH